MAKHKHLTLDERFKIQHMLDSKESFASIARTLGRDRSTISKEIRSHLTFKKSGSFGASFNDCANRTHCGKFFYNGIAVKSEKTAVISPASVLSKTAGGSFIILTLLNSSAILAWAFLIAISLEGASTFIKPRTKEPLFVV